MGASEFYVVASGKTAQDAFRAARDAARGDSEGEEGYSGTIYEKDYFVMVDDKPEAVAARVRAKMPESSDRARRLEQLADPKKAARAVAGALVDLEDQRIDEKTGPAGCIPMGENRYLFFGWASD